MKKRKPTQEELQDIKDSRRALADPERISYEQLKRQLKAIPPPSKYWFRKMFSGLKLSRTQKKSWAWSNGKYVPMIQQYFPPIRPTVAGTYSCNGSYVCSPLNNHPYAISRMS